LKARGRAAIQVRELMLEGVLSIADGVNQKLIRLKLDAYLGHSPAAKAGKKKGQTAAQPLSAEG
jgi:flagellar motor component MotA